MGESNTRRIQRLGQKVADELVAESPPPDKVYERSALLQRADLKSDPESRQDMLFFGALNERLKDKAGRMYVVAGPGKVTICAKEDTVATSETLACREADRALDRHINTVGLVSKHLDHQGRAAAAESIARVAGLAAQIRHTEAKAAQALSAPGSSK